MTDNQQMDIFDFIPDPNGWSGRTCQEPIVRLEKECKKDQTSRLSSRKSSESLNRMLPLCLYLKKDGQNLDVSTMKWEDGAWPGSCTMPSGGAFLKDGNGLLLLPTLTDSTQPKCYLEINCGEMPIEPMPTKLSQILEENADPKYQLSARACAGILNRAAKRGKELPEILKMALEAQMNRPIDTLTSDEDETSG